MIFTRSHYVVRTIFRSLLSPDFFDPLFSKGKSGDKCDRFASPDSFCPLRYRVNV